MEPIQMSSLFDESIVYGREDDKRSVVGLVLSDDCKTRNVNFICIVAPSGTGKSTVAHLVYYEKAVLDAFDAHMFMYTPEKFDEKMLMKEMIESLTRSCCRETEMDQLEEILVDELIGKKILLVLDNTENENPGFWNNVGSLLNHGYKGSVVLVTTKSKAVADSMGIVHCYYLNPLSDYYCWLIFEQHVFGDLNTNANPDLVHIGKQLISKCENNLLVIKVLSGLLCSQNQQSWIAFSINELWETGYCSAGAFPVLKNLYDYVPLHLKNCLQYFFLFPKGYILLKHQIIRLWISAGLIIHVEGREPEDEGAQYFNELLSRAFIVHSPIHNSKEEKYIMHELIHDLLRNDECSRSDDRLLNFVNGKCIHFSLVPSEIQSNMVNARKEIRNLETFLVVGSSCSQPGRKFPILNLFDLNNLFANSTSLRILDLSYTDIAELPGSICLLRNLSYLGVNNSKITSLPREMCTIVSLQTLKAKECYNLVELPENLKELTNLRYLDVIKKSSFVKMPVGIGQLTNLRILTTFNVGPQKHQCRIEELKDLNHLRGCLQIAGLENIDSGASAREANLKSKLNLAVLCLQWSNTDRGDRNATIAKEVFENLETNNCLEELTVRNYVGREFPVWLGDPSFTQLVSIVIDKCVNCSKFPALGGLPSLRQLSVQKIYHVKRLETTGCIVGTNCVFPSLEILNIWEMYDLEELFEVNDGDFPCLHTLSINRCPMLKNIPCFPSLIELSIYCCIKLPYISDLPSLKSLRIDGFQKIKSLDLTCNLPMLKSLEIRHCAELLSVEKLSNFSSLVELNVDCCPKFASLDSWVRMDLKAKRCCFIKKKSAKQIEDQQEPLIFKTPEADRYSAQRFLKTQVFSPQILFMPSISPPHSPTTLVPSGSGSSTGAATSPKTSISNNEFIEKEHMFDKVLTPSDVGKLNRLVIPRKHAEKYFQTTEKGLLLSFEDLAGKPWRFRYFYWDSSQSCVITKGWSRFVKENQLSAGDTVSFGRGVGQKANDRLFIDWKRRADRAIQSSSQALTDPDANKRIRLLGLNNDNCHFLTLGMPTRQFSSSNTSNDESNPAAVDESPSPSRKEAISSME